MKIVDFLYCYKNDKGDLRNDSMYVDVIFLYLGIFYYNFFIKVYIEYVWKLYYNLLVRDIVLNNKMFILNLWFFYIF